eukprot:COSAG05_NODE_250_length_12887_cov_28.030810_7_plen_165_part_00
MHRLDLAFELRGGSGWHQDGDGPRAAASAERTTNTVRTRRHTSQPKMRDLARRCRGSMRHQGVAGSPPPAVLIPQDVRNVVREPASHALGQRGLSARSAAADTRPSCLTLARLAGCLRIMHGRRIHSRGLLLGSRAASGELACLTGGLKQAWHRLCNSYRAAVL